MTGHFLYPTAIPSTLLTLISAVRLMPSHTLNFFLNFPHMGSLVTSTSGSRLSYLIGNNLFETILLVPRFVQFWAVWSRVVFWSAPFQRLYKWRHWLTRQKHYCKIIRRRPETLHQHNNIIHTQSSTSTKWNSPLVKRMAASHIIFEMHHTSPWQMQNTIPISLSKYSKYWICSSNWPWHYHRPKSPIHRPCSGHSFTNQNPFGSNWRYRRIHSVCFGFRKQRVGFHFLTPKPCKPRHPFFYTSKYGNLPVNTKKSKFFLHGFSWYLTPNMALQKIILTFFWRYRLRQYLHSVCFGFRTQRVGFYFLTPKPF